MENFKEVKGLKDLLKKARTGRKRTNYILIDNKEKSLDLDDFRNRSNVLTKLIILARHEGYNVNLALVVKKQKRLY